MSTHPARSETLIASRSPWPESSRISHFVLVATAVTTVVVSTVVLTMRGLDARATSSLWRLLARAFPPRLDVTFLRSLVRPSVETLEISILGTGLACLIGFPLSICGARTIIAGDLWGESPSWYARICFWVICSAARGTLNVLRSVPKLVWALLFVGMTGLGAVPGILAIGLAHGGVLGKVFSEIFEEVPPMPAAVLRSAGATRRQLFAYALLPAARPRLFAYALYRWECAVRTSTVLGLVGAGGLGTEVAMSMRMLRFDEVITELLALFVLVCGAELLSASMRTRVLPQ